MQTQRPTGINNYDNAMLNKVKAWFPNTIYANTAITYATIFNLADTPDAKLKLPLINVYRPRGFNPVPQQNFAATKQGQLFNSMGVGARYITVDLMYQFDIYTKRPEDVNTMSEQLTLLFNFYPKLEIKHVDKRTDEEFRESYDITYLSGPSDQAEFDNNDRTYRYYIQYEIKNAKIYDFTDFAEIIETEIDLTLEDNEI